MFRNTGFARITRFAESVAVAALLLPCALVSTAQVRAQSGGRRTTDAARIHSLSGRADLLSGGDALIRIDVPKGTALSAVRVLLNDADVTQAFRSDTRTHALTGLVAGLSPGSNTLLARFGSGNGRNAAERLTLVNHSVTGPVFSGPQEQPFICETQSFKLRSGGTLGAPLDASCSIARRTDYVYRSTAGGDLKPLPDVRNLPNDIAQTTTLLGAAVPYIVRIETGTIDRAIYQIAILHDPTHEPQPDFATAPAGWNRRLIYTFGGGCMPGWFHQAITTGGVEDDVLLRQGYAVASSTLNVAGNNCNMMLSAEVMMMVKERFIEGYGVPNFTIGYGCSGGSYQQHEIADNYPGLLDGLIPGCSFPEMTHSLTTTSADSRLLLHYFKLPGAVPFTDAQRQAVSGYLSLATFMNAAEQSAARINPTETCPAVLPAELRYNAVSNRTGARCTIYDHTINVYGRDPKTGFARRPLDNVGIQYGLGTLNAGVISKEQFLDLNEKVGGYDADANPVPQRTVADREVVRIAYRTGRITNGGGGLATIPILDYRAYADDAPKGDPHQRYHSFVTRARLLKANGQTDNQVMLIEDSRYGLYSTQSPLLRESIAQMDKWLTALSEDTSKDAPIVKIRRAKPGDLVDACLTRDKIPQRIIETQAMGSGRCDQLYPTGSFPRGVAGSPIVNDVIKCQVKRIDGADYKVSFSVAEKARLQAIFPDGVCDWSKPGIEQQRLAGTWLNFGRPIRPTSLR